VRGTTWCETNIVIGSMSRGDVLYIQIPNLISKGVFRATLIMLYFVAGHGAAVQPASINVVFGYKQAQQYSRIHQLGFIRAVSWSAQKHESYWLHVHMTLIVEHFNFHAFYKKCGLQRNLMLFK